MKYVLVGMLVLSVMLITGLILAAPLPWEVR